MKYLLVGLAMLAGVAISIQVAVNTQLRQNLHHPMQATLVSFSVGGIAALIYCLLTLHPLPERQHLATLPWWIWSGGLLGLLYIWTTVVVTPKLGAATMLTFAIAGQLLASSMIDHFGWFNMPIIETGGWRLLGMLLVVAGASIILFTK